MNYSINIYWDDEEKAYRAVIPEFKDLSSCGSSYEEAFQAIQHSLEERIQKTQAESLPLPKAATLSHYSGQLRLRMPKSLHQELTQQAAQEGLSLNAYIVYLLSKKHIVHTAKTEIDHHLKGFVAFVQQVLLQRLSK